jgi:hypothetical protein
MTKPNVSTKQLAIDKSNTQMVAVVAAACFVTIFCLFAAKAVLSNNMYQSKVINAKQKAHDQLEANLASFTKLQTAYDAFDNAGTNIIGGLKDGTGDNDGSNSKIILDALPTTYDFPALASSIEKILGDINLHVSGIQGTDDQVNQQTNTSSPNPQPVEIPFSFTVEQVNYKSVQAVMNALQHSVRPIQVDKINVTGGGDSMTLNIDAHTYYQPIKSVDVQKETVK